MTTRTNTVEYAFPFSAASVASAANRDFTAITVALPSVSAFKSVHLEVSATDDLGTAANLTAVAIGIQLNAVAINTSTVTFTVTNSGENQAFLFTRDVTSYFTTNWAGTSMTALARVVFTGVSTINATAKLVITYEYDDTAATTKIKTVRIPVDGNTGNLTTTLTALGGVSNQIPALDTFLPEAAKTIQSFFFQMDVNTATSAAAAAALTMRYDGATSVSDTSWGHTLNSDTFYRRIDDLSALSTSAAHTIEAAVTGTVTGFNGSCLNGVIVVTYTFTPVANTTLNGSIDSSQTSVVVTDASTWPAAPFTIQVDTEKLRVTARSTNTLTVTRGYDGTSAAAHSTGADVLATIMNSVMITAVDEAGWAGGTATDKGRFKRDILINEPGFIQLQQSGVLVTQNDAGSPALDLRVGSQASRVFTHQATAHCGGFSSMRRIDAGSAGGVAGMTLDRGRNDLIVDYFTTSATAGNLGSNTSAALFLNYTSGQSALGGVDHNHSVAFILLPWETGGNVQRKVKSPTATTPAIAEANYFIMAASYWLVLQTSGTAVGNLAVTMNAEVLSGEAEGAGWRALYSALFASDAEIGPSISFARGRTEFKRWPLDPDTSRLDIESARRYRFDVNLNRGCSWQCVAWVTYSAITFSKSIAITGTGGGTATVNVRRASTGEVVWSGSRVGDGSVTATLYEDTDTKFTEVRVSDLLVGRSGDWT